VGIRSRLAAAGPARSDRTGAGRSRKILQLILDMLARPNICSKEWVCRQYDHEVQGTSVIKPLVGAGRDVPTDAAVIRPVLDLPARTGFPQALIPMYSAIDAYHMTACTIDEAVRRAIAVGGNPDHLGGVDNFCWPNIQYDAGQKSRRPAQGRPTGAVVQGARKPCAWPTAFRCSPARTPCMWTAICRDVMGKPTKSRRWRRCNFPSPA
jgi:hypothetical protein